MKLALAGDTMLGRLVGEKLQRSPPESLFAREVVDAVAEADLCIVNLECCISERGEPAPGRVFHFRAPPAAVDALVHLGVDCVTLANNHALDFGPDALEDTLAYLDAAGIAHVGAGPDACTPRVVDGLRIVALTDHPAEYASHVAFADLWRGQVPAWVLDAITGTTLVTPHWGPNMTAAPIRHVRAVAKQLVEAGATLVAGHSAHVFHGVAPHVLYDLGDFLDDYRVDPELRNDLGLLFLVDLAGDRLEAIPLKLELAHTRLATGDDAAWIERRFIRACAQFGTDASVEDGRIVARWR